MRARRSHIARLLLLLWSQIFFFTSCLDVPTEPVDDRVPQILVVEGFLLAHEPIRNIHLQWLDPLTEELRPASGLDVFVESEDGFVVLTDGDTLPGFYQDLNFEEIVEPGEMYTLVVSSDTAVYTATTQIPEDIEDFELNSDVIRYQPDLDTAEQEIPDFLEVEWEAPDDEVNNFYLAEVFELRVDTLFNPPAVLTAEQELLIRNFDIPTTETRAFVFPGQLTGYGIYLLNITTINEEFFELSGGIIGGGLIGGNEEGNIEGGVGLFTGVNQKQVVFFVIP